MLQILKLFFLEGKWEDCEDGAYVLGYTLRYNDYVAQPFIQTFIQSFIQMFIQSLASPVK